MEDKGILDVVERPLTTSEKFRLFLMTQKMDVIP